MRTSSSPASSRPAPTPGTWSGRCCRGAGREEVDRVVELRAERQLRLMNRPLPKVTALLEEGVLHRRCGNAAVMDEQLTHLLRAAHCGKVSLRILPMDRAYGATPPHPITHLRFRDGEHAELAYVEHINGANYVTRPRALDDYRNVLANLRHAAAAEDESVDLILAAQRRFSAGELRAG
ncbi:DUF5753 domain-containing protein [Streptomyces vinaceus]|uniref:DUF5753 domain-containing protein n=1 Tax=Streptomyces vinaceus TaxID=1960 RepID=UPI0037F36888